MGEITLFSLENGKATERHSQSVVLERKLQTIVEQNMDTFFGVTFLQSEYSTTNGGRMDSIGIDQNNCPVIFEYKRETNENVINQGLFYLDWLMAHKDSFKLLLLDKLGPDHGITVDWSSPRVICIASDFSKYDKCAINQMIRNISLVRYKLYGDDLIMFELINDNAQSVRQGSAKRDGGSDEVMEQKVVRSSQVVQDVYSAVKEFILGLGDDVNEHHLKCYTAFKKIKNIVCAEVQKEKILLHVQLDVDSVEYESGFSRKTEKQSHFGTGEVELTLKDMASFEKAKPFLERAYNEN